MKEHAHELYPTVEGRAAPLHFKNFLHENIWQIMQNTVQRKSEDIRKKYAKEK